MIWAEQGGAPIILRFLGGRGDSDPSFASPPRLANQPHPNDSRKGDWKSSK
jgi:hypothetical protein